MEIVKVLAFARRLLEAVADGRLELSKIKGITDEELVTYDAAAYQALVDAQAENERLAAGEVVIDEGND